MTKRIATVLCVGLIAITGCTGPVIMKEIRETSWPVSGFAEVRQNPEKFKNKTIIIGGTIIDTINNEDGSTTLIVLNFPLDDGEQPAKWENSQGRFMVNTPQFLDPQVYARDREVTVAGVVIGVETAPMGETKYRYVILNALQLYLWPQWYQRFNFPVYPELYPGRFTDGDDFF